MKMREIIRLAEGPQPKILFHATTIYSLVLIMADNALAALTTDTAPGVKGPGVCLTRSYEYAQKHKGPRRGIILVLNANGLETTPVQYWSPEDQKRYNRDDEGEEFVSGPVTNLRSQIISINAQTVTPEMFEQRATEIATVENHDWSGMKPGTYEHIQKEEVQEREKVKAYIASHLNSDLSLWNRWHP